MLFKCKNCGEEFNGVVDNEKRTCPDCESLGQDHIPLITAATWRDQVPLTED